MLHCYLIENKKTDYIKMQAVFLGVKNKYFNALNIYLCVIITNISICSIISTTLKGSLSLLIIQKFLTN